MNHDGELKTLSIFLKRAIAAFNEDVNDVMSAKHRTEQKQKLDKAVWYSVKMFEELDDLNEWLTAFGPGSDYQ